MDLHLKLHHEIDHLAMFGLVDVSLPSTLSQRSDILFFAHFTASHCVAVERALEIDGSPDFFCTGHFPSFCGDFGDAESTSLFLQGRCVDGYGLPVQPSLLFLRLQQFVALLEDPIDGLRGAGVQAETAAFEAA